jgi:hypothetical protein
MRGNGREAGRPAVGDVTLFYFWYLFHG